MSKIKINTISGLLMGITMLLITLLGFTPSLRLGTGNLYLVICFLVVLVVLLNINTTGFRQNKPLFVSVCAYIIMVLSYKVLNISTASNITVFRHFFFFVPILLMPLIPEYFSNRKKLILLMVGLMLYVAADNIIDNIRLCLKHPELFLMVNRDMKVGDMEGLGNIGGSQWYNSIFFFFLICFFAYLNIGTKIVKNILLAISVLSAVFLLLFCLKASVIVFTLLSIILLISAKRVKNVHRLIVSLLFVYLFVFLIVGLYADELTEMLQSMITSDRLLGRLIMLIDPESAEASAGTGTMNARSELWMESINTWLSSPDNFLLGIGAPPTSDIHAGVGQHSDLFDSLARYGLIGSFLIFNSLRMGYKYIQTLLGEKERPQLFAMAMLFVLFSATKGVFNPAIGSSLFLLLPLLSLFVENEKIEQSDN